MELGCYIFELLLYSTNLFFLTERIFLCDVNRKNYWISISILHIVLIVMSLTCEYSFSMYFLMLAQILQIVFLKFYSKNLKSLKLLGAYFLIYSINLILSFSATVIWGAIDKTLLLVDTGINFVVFLFCIILYFNVTLSTKIKQILDIVPKNIKVLIIISCLINAIFLILLCSNPIFYENTTWTVFVKVFSILLIVLFFTALPIWIITSLSIFYLKNQNIEFQKDIEAQANHYYELSKANYELRRFKHDFNNIKIGLTKVLQDHDCSSALSILSSAEYNMHRNIEAMISFDTGNSIVDAILTEKQKQADLHHAKILFSGSVPPNSIAPTDLCVLFGNTLDNAIEACERIHSNSEKTIVISCLCNSGFMFLSISNPVKEDVEIYGSTIATSKKDKTMHGYGLYSLNKTVQHLDGTLNLSCKNKIFKVEIDLYLKGSYIYS